ncbi:hypothetical protein A2U01_0008243, partial [Trifolium medium]|nr:hypothetical protein [Trifolium medium]
ISIVPEKLKNSSNEDAYMPRVVSIGPRFKGSREDLLLMEEVKLRSMLSLLHRAGKAGESKTYLQKCSKAIWKINKQVRASYVSNIKVENNELAKIMLVDGCFLLELMIANKLESQLPSRLCPSGPAHDVLKDEDVLSDLMLVENQIPILVLHILSKILFPNVFDPTRKEERAKKINSLALSVLGYSPLHLPCLESPHILDLVYFFVNGSTVARTGTPTQEEDHVVLDIFDTTHTRQQQLRLKRCALRLLTAGVTIKVKLPEDKDSTGFGAVSCFRLVWNSFCGMLFWLCNIFLVNGKHMDLDRIPEEVEVKGLDFYFKFEKGKLEIEQLHITNTTKAKWCNLIAWEHHKKNWKSSSSMVSGYESSDDENLVSTSSPSGKFTWAALIFNGLICSADDIQLLKDRKVVVDHLRMSNQELMEFFSKIASGVDHGVVDYRSYIEMVDDINNFSKPR